MDDARAGDLQGNAADAVGDRGADRALWVDPTHARASPYLASSALTAPTWVSPELQADRIAAFAKTGFWPPHWGPEPTTQTPTTESA